jgi:diaminohydroxyphosphoribosylaminopyrimidine deaminase/5-amino-6-(5-phosphoribosylamino)uracil reductase
MRDKDAYYMARALELAKKGKGRTSPNPAVGAVIVRGNRIVGEGYHRKAGTAHAEVVALKKAGEAARGATIYVTLEPCCHTDKRTPPCTDALIKAGIRHAVVAVRDPNPRVAGRGIRLLRKAGIETTTGIMKEEAFRLNEDFAKFITTGMPFVTLKIAQSLDGKIAASSGDSKWITGEKARRHVHQMRNEYDAIMVGLGTVLSDDPSLDCRIRGGRNPYRVIVDSSLGIPMNAKLLSHDDSRTVIATTQNAPAGKKEKLLASGVSVITVKGRSKHVDLRALMQELGRLGIMSVMIEGGSRLAGSAIRDGIVDKVMFYVAPRIIGGDDAVPSVGGVAPRFIKDSTLLEDLTVSKNGQDILIEGYIRRTD